MTESRNVERRYSSKRIWLHLAAIVTSVCISCPAGAGQPDLTGMDIEQLMAVKVTSVSKKAQQLSDSAAAIFVITNNDLRRSGVTNIADALRMVPGLNVARIDANKWAVNSRGSQGRFSDKLLVLIDGRSVYTPTFSGVYWEVQDVMLEDVERIEVIRGPGATLWGANAVNGVINIITKAAQDTRGGLISAGGGSFEKAFAAARYGVALGTGTYARIYAKGFERDEFELPGGGGAGDDWGMRQTGFRLDADLSASDSLTLQGDMYQGDINQRFMFPSISPPYISIVNDDGKVSGGNLLARWQRILSSTSELSLLAYYDRTDRQEALANQERDSFNVDLQHHFKAAGRHDIIWGGRYFRLQDDFDNTFIVTLDPVSRSDDLFSAFIQDEITLRPEKLWFTLGTKIEHNDYTGFEIQPSARLFWSLSSEQKTWAAISRAVRTPSRVEADGQVINGVIPPTGGPSLPVALVVTGNQDFHSENMMAYELGYRLVPRHDFSLDLAVYFHDYDSLRDTEAGLPVFMGTYVRQPLNFTNGESAQTYGLELAAAWQTLDRLKLDLAYTFTEGNLGQTGVVGKTPKHQVSLRSALKLGETLDLDMWLRYVDNASTVSASSTNYQFPIDDYLTLDLRLAWRPVASLECSLVGQNLLDDGHVEFVQEAYIAPAEVPRSVYANITYRF